MSGSGIHEIDESPGSPGVRILGPSIVYASRYWYAVTQQQHMRGMAYACIRRRACMAYSHTLCSSWRCGVLDILDPWILDGMRHRRGRDPGDLQNG